MSFIKKIHVQMDRHVQMYMYMDMDILYHRMVMYRVVLLKFRILGQNNIFFTQPLLTFSRVTPPSRVFLHHMMTFLIFSYKHDRNMTDTATKHVFIAVMVENDTLNIF